MRDSLHAGARPQAMVEKVVAANANRRTRQSVWTSSNRGSSIGAAPVKARRPASLNHRPRLPSIATSTSASFSTWPNKRARPAQRARRTPASRYRPAVRTSMRFPTLTQTISRTAGDLLEQWKQRGLGSDVILPDEIRQQKIQFRGGMRRRNAGFQPDDRSIVEAAGW